MRNFIQPGDTAVVPAPAGGAVSGDFVLIGGVGGVAKGTALAGADCVLELEGVYSLPKVAAQAWAQFDLLYWDAAAKNFTKTSAGNTRYGFAFAAALAAATSGAVSIYPL